jgi:hypothetical protein
MVVSKMQEATTSTHVLARKDFIPVIRFIQIVWLRTLIMSHRSHRRIWRVLSACTRDYQRLRWDIGVGAYFGDHANPARIAITAQIAEDIARREVGRHAASFDTRWVPLAVGNRFFDSLAGPPAGRAVTWKAF